MKATWLESRTANSRLIDGLFLLAFLFYGAGDGLATSGGRRA